MISVLSGRWKFVMSASTHLIAPRLAMSIGTPMDSRVMESVVSMTSISPTGSTLSFSSTLIRIGSSAS